MMTAFHYDKDHIIKRSRMEGLEGVTFKQPVDPERLRRVIASPSAGLKRSSYLGSRSPLGGAPCA